MNSFFDLSDGSKPEAKKEFDGGGGNFDPIPSKTQVLASPDEVKWSDPHETADCQNKLISIRWTILAPAEYKNRKIFQKVKVNDTDEKVSDKARRMLAAIDFNAGGELMTLDHAPTDADLAKALIAKQMILMLQVWDYEGKVGNWVSAVCAKGATDVSTHEPQTRTEQRKPEKKPADFDDDIPF